MKTIGESALSKEQQKLDLLLPPIYSKHHCLKMIASFLISLTATTTHIYLIFPTTYKPFTAKKIHL